MALTRLWRSAWPLALAIACVPAQQIAVATPDTLELTRTPVGFPGSCGSGQVEVMLLGSYHFAGSTTDALGREAHDVLSDRRQAEIRELVNRLATWRPQQIAVEWPFTLADSTQARYGRFRAGTLAPTRNEVVQVGFRLAHQLGHDRVYPIDHPMNLGNDSLAALSERRPDLRSRGDSLLAVLRHRSDSIGVLMHDESIIDHLRRTNSEEALHGGNSFGMFGTFIAAGEGTNYGGPQLLARWYERNIVMVHHIARVLRPETHRVLVIVGSGHVPAMRNILDESPQFCPVSPLPLLQ